jgi:hypothetical protein
MRRSIFEYLMPTDEQQIDMQVMRDAFGTLFDLLDETVPDGADKNHALRKLRECAMWVSVAITREDNGAPRR